MAGNKRLGYPGGKGAVGVYQTIINCMPPHEIYVEPFLGSGAVLRHKRLATRSIGIDLDIDVIRKWRSLSLPSLQIIHGDALRKLASWKWTEHDRKRTLIYCDPPYPNFVRRSARRIYKYELGSEAENKRLFQILIDLPCMVVLSGYRSQLYDSIVGHWRQLDFSTVNRAAKTTTETIWMNFSPPSVLHDYQYLGTDFRERERIKRKLLRWQKRFARMTELEQHAVLSALQNGSSNMIDR